MLLSPLVAKNVAQVKILAPILPHNTRILHCVHHSVNVICFLHFRLNMDSLAFKCLCGGPDVILRSILPLSLGFISRTLNTGMGRG
jgi:hypothetical protein